MNCAASTDELDDPVMTIVKTEGERGS